ncbi:MAG: response regulator transcription factor [Planctomycetota bacterium]
MRILVVEDEAELRGAIARRLRAQGNGVDEAPDVRTARFLVSNQDFAVVILDRMLPDGDAVEEVRRWRHDGLRTPVLILTARDRVEERVEGLEAGADDYLVKPFAMDELLARVAAVGRREAAPTPSVLRFGNVEVDTGRRELRRAGVLIPLRPKEYALLTLLAARAGRVVTRGEIIDACWDEAHELTSNVDEVLVASLRRKLGKPSPIRTVRGAGYLLEEAPAER